MTRDNRVYGKVIVAYEKLPQDQQNMICSIDGIKKQEVVQEINRRDETLPSNWREEVLRRFGEIE